MLVGGIIMEKNLETECKVLLNSDDYRRIYDYFNLNESMVIKQVNYYFDTNDMNLVKNKFNCLLWRKGL